MNETNHADHANHLDDNEIQQVVAYLQTHPDFFVTHESLLHNLTIPHHCGSARSLIEYRVLQLTQKNELLKQQLNTLIAIARDNDELYNQLHHFILAMLAHRDLSQTLETIRTHLKDNFRADAVSIHLLGEESQQMCADGYAINPLDSRLDNFSQVFAKQQPVCGRLKTEQLEFLFSEQAPTIKSSVLLPLTNSQNQRIGLLAIGSHDSQRFPPGMGTTFLHQMGSIISQVLSYHLPQP